MQSYQTKRLKQITKKANQAKDGQRVKPFRTLYIPKKSQIKGFVNIYMQISIEGERRCFSVGVKAKAIDWNKATQTVKGNKAVNDILRTIDNEVHKVNSYNVQIERKTTFKVLKEIVIGLVNHQDVTPSFSYCLDKEIDDYAKLYEAKQVTKAVFSHNKRFVKHIKDFMAYKYKNPFLLLEDIRPIFASELVLYIRTVLKLSENSVIKIVGFAKRVLYKAVDAEYIDKNPLANIAKFKRKRLDVIFLETFEVAKIENFKHFTNELQTVADCFLFCCYTGLSYCDAKSLTDSNITVVNGEWSIIKERSKSKEVQAIYLRPEAFHILAKYEYFRNSHKDGFCLPFISNQRMNQSLKAIEGITGIKKRLTTHVARKTAVNFYVNGGANQFTIKSLMGHSSIQTTEKHYIAKNMETSISNQKNIYNELKKTK